MLIKFLDGTSREVADLRGADLRGADLCGTYLRGAYLRGAYLRGADLCGADLCGANLCGANLRGADLCGANLCGANLYGANLYGAYLRGANLYGAKGLAQFIVAGEGDLIGYKKLSGGTIAKLLIPAAAARVNAYGSRKCRAEYVEVLEGSGIAQHDGATEYAPGIRVTPDSYDPDPRVECSHGIHFFITRAEAGEY